MPFASGSKERTELFEMKNCQRQSKILIYICSGYCGVDDFWLLPETSTDTRNFTDCSKLCILELEHSLSVRHKSVDK
jgi:hypothetical protein